MSRTTNIVKRNGRPWAVERAKLRLSHSRFGEKTFSGERVTLGSSEQCDFCLPDKTVSRHHARIETRGDALLVRDLNSTNGTFINETRVELGHLPPDGILRLGGLSVQVRISDELHTTELSEHDGCGKLVGHSVAMRALFKDIERAARSDASILIVGESGVGKELVAKALHSLSARRDAPFEVVDCGALAPGIVDDELFGHVRGAYTGADSDRPGPFEIADGGTVFIDEIGELDLALQPRLLRILESGTVRRVGSTERQQVDVRVVAATHRDLAAMVTSGEFRSDLYYRLNVVELVVPPLRERLEDLDILCDVLLREIRDRHPQAAPFPVDDEVLAALRTRRWSGNIRELRNFLERAVVLESRIGRFDADAEFNYDRARAAAIERFEADFMRRAIDAFGDNQSRIAREAGINRSTVLRLLRKHGLR